MELMEDVGELLSRVGRRHDSDGVVLFGESIPCGDSALRADGRTVVRPYKRVYHSEH
jgi:hypothetical protein